MSLQGKLDDRQRTPGIQQRSRRVQSLTRKQPDQHATTCQVEQHKDGLEKIQAARHNQIAEQVDILRTGGIERRHVAIAAVDEDKIAQWLQNLVSGSQDIGTVAVQEDARVPDVAPGIVREVGRERKQKGTQEQSSA